MGELGDGGRGSEKWENSQKGGSFSVGEGAWCWEWGVVTEWRIREGHGPGKKDGSSGGARGGGSGTTLVIRSPDEVLNPPLPLSSQPPHSLNTAIPKGLSKGLS